MNCPLCTDQILEPRYRAGIEIDVCPHCRGVWLDRGELDKLVANADPVPVAPQPGPPPIAPQPDHLRSGPDDRDDLVDRRYYSDEGKSDKGKKQNKKSVKKRKKKKSWGEMLGDVLEEVLD